MPTLDARLAKLEAERPFIKDKLVTMDKKLDKLVAAHDRQTGAARLGAILWAGFIGIGGLLAGLFLGKPHA